LREHGLDVVAAAIERAPEVRFAFEPGGPTDWMKRLRA
jgi:hypothetical protein